jgi:peptidyl-prolyl cis-trans isomerase B (cyclophilin B)
LVAQKSMVRILCGLPPFRENRTSPKYGIHPMGRRNKMAFPISFSAVRRGRPSIAGVLVTAFALLGCGGGEGTERTAATKTGPGEKKEEGSAHSTAPKAQEARKEVFLSQSFAEATISEDDAPEGQILPGETMTGKSVGKLFTEVKSQWNTIPLISAAGKKISCTAILETEAGVIEIALRPDVAPNHVRNFVALARVGYFDGLLFERKHHEESDVNPGEVLEYIEAGCPMGNGDENFGSIGYWLKPELSDKVTHEEGTVGAWHKEEADTAACKFYITLTKAPVMDGNFTVFGKVTRGMEVVRAIARRPIRKEDEAHDRPENPVTIKKVTIRTSE